MKKKLSAHSLLLATLAIMLCASISRADTVSFSGNTTGNPTFNRPVTTTALSAVGTAVPYAVTQLTVSLTGSYTFTTTSQTTGYDPFIVLYQINFNPAAPLTNIVTLNDDFGGSFTVSQFTVNLEQGVNYFFVNTGFDNTDFGAFLSVITGPGVISIVGAANPIPEPATMLLLGTGLLGIGAARRRNKSTAV